jgi:hypothetical protein
MTKHENQRLINKLHRIAFELRHDNDTRISNPDMRANVKLYAAIFDLEDAAQRLKDWQDR